MTNSHHFLEWCYLPGQQQYIPEGKTSSWKVRFSTWPGIFSENFRKFCVKVVNKRWYNCIKSVFQKKLFHLYLSQSYLMCQNVFWFQVELTWVFICRWNSRGLLKFIVIFVTQFWSLNKYILISLNCNKCLMSFQLNGRIISMKFIYFCEIHILPGKFTFWI